MFVNHDYLDYHYLVSVSDNYVVLSNQRTVNADWQNPKTIDVVYQYNYPSILTIESERSFTSSQIFNSVDVTDDFYSRADCPLIFICVFIAILFSLYIINGLTKFVKRGGIFFGS